MQDGTLRSLRQHGEERGEGRKPLPLVHVMGKLGVYNLIVTTSVCGGEKLLSQHACEELEDISDQRIAETRLAVGFQPCAKADPGCLHRSYVIALVSNLNCLEWQTLIKFE